LEVEDDAVSFSLLEVREEDATSSFSPFVATTSVALFPPPLASLAFDPWPDNAELVSALDVLRFCETQQVKKVTNENKE
jgi:hypothetical protein